MVTLGSLGRQHYPHLPKRNYPTYFSARDVSSENDYNAVFDNNAGYDESKWRCQLQKNA